jgi:DnaJ domain
MRQSFEFDPTDVLDLATGSSLEEIREAYRNKTKKHHPDHGGDEWAFRLVTQAYEAMGQARVAGYLVDHDQPDHTPRPRRVRPATDDSEGTTVRKGLRDKVSDNLLLVDAESLILRLELDNPYELLTTPGAERNLSCSLRLSWPSVLSSEGEIGKSGGSASDSRLRQIIEAFDATVRQVETLESWRHAENDRFTGMVSLPSARQTSDAFMILRTELRSRGLGANQWTREIVIPRDRVGGAA